MDKINKIASKKSTDYAVKGDGIIIKDVDMNKRIVTGLYNTFNYFDSDYDVILPGATQKSITERGPDSSATAKIKHLLFHDWTKLPGKIITLGEKTVNVEGKQVQGVYFETQMADTEMGRDTVVNYQSEIYDNHSIGFRFLDGEWLDEDSDNWDKMVAQVINQDDIRKAGFAYFWKEIMLYEGSTVAFGANSLTPYLGVKDLKNKDAVIMKFMNRIEALQKQVRGGTQTDETLQSFDMQILQIKQLISELIKAEPSDRSIPAKGPGTKDTAKIITCDGCGTDFDAQSMTSNADGAYECPGCQTLCMSKSSSSFLSKLQFI